MAGIPVDALAAGVAEAEAEVEEEEDAEDEGRDGGLFLGVAARWGGEGILNQRGQGVGFGFVRFEFVFLDQGRERLNMNVQLRGEDAGNDFSDSQTTGITTGKVGSGIGGHG